MERGYLADASVKNNGTGTLAYDKGDWALGYDCKGRNDSDGGAMHTVGRARRRKDPNDGDAETGARGGYLAHINVTGDEDGNGSGGSTKWGGCKERSGSNDGGARTNAGGGHLGDVEGGNDAAPPPASSY